MIFPKFILLTVGLILLQDLVIEGSPSLERANLLRLKNAMRTGQDLRSDVIFRPPGMAHLRKTGVSLYKRQRAKPCRFGFPYYPVYPPAPVYPVYPIYPAATNPFRTTSGSSVGTVLNSVASTANRTLPLRLVRRLSTARPTILRYYGKK